MGYNPMCTLLLSGLCCWLWCMVEWLIGWHVVVEVLVGLVRCVYEVWMFVGC